jgi:hypothetical protein
VLIGQARVSTTEQKHELQADAIAAPVFEGNLLPGSTWSREFMTWFSTLWGLSSGSPRPRQV